MQDNLLTAGEFAKLARTTKRTVLWYAQKGILTPYKTDGSGYRFYQPQQIIDFQSVLLMRKLGFSLADIKAYLEQGRPLQQLFDAKRSALEQQIDGLQRMLTNTDRYYRNLQATGTLVQPNIKEVGACDVHYIYKEGPYAKIKEYLNELRAMFTALPADPVFLTIFIDRDYRPRMARMKIGVMHQPGIRLKPGTLVYRETIPPYKALCCMHQGSSALLSLLWQELEKYCAHKRLAPDTSLPFAGIEFYNLNDRPGIYEEDELLTTELREPVR